MYGYLMHHGVKGMKWGIRHYQNKDGSLTAEGRVRYSKSSSNRNIQNAYNEYKKNNEKIYDEYLKESDKKEREQKAWEKEQYKKAGFKSSNDAYNKAYKENRDIPYEKSIWNTINRIEDKSYDIFNEQYNDIIKKRKEKYVKNGEKFVDTFMSNKNISQFKMKDILPFTKRSWNEEHEEMYEDYDWEQLYDFMDDSNRYSLDWDDDGNVIIKKK